MPLAASIGCWFTAPNFTWILHAGPTVPDVVCIDTQTIELREPTAGRPLDRFSARFRNTRAKPFAVGDVVSPPF